MGLARAFWLVALLSVGPAAAADLPQQSGPSSLPTLAADPNAFSPNWTGLYVGGGISASFAKGVKGAAGGEAFAGYDHAFDNNLVLGVRASTGYAPYFVSGSRFNGLSYGLAEAKLGYAMGQLTPYVVAGVGVARATAWSGGFANPTDNLNSLFAGPGAAQTFGAVGLGATYAITNNVKVGIEARMYSPGAAIGN
jgi:opacity protein-like surface antigen